MTRSANLQFDLEFNAPSARMELLERWKQFVNNVLPNMVAAHGWSISQNHCFMRVCLDTSFGCPWQTVVKRPATRYMTDDQLRAAIAVAERIIASPALLAELNRKSILDRKSILR
jgi:hypothetical protein